MKAGRGETIWSQVLLSYLDGQEESQSVSEITLGVSAARPERTVKATVCVAEQTDNDS